MSYRSSLTALWLISVTLCLSALAACTTLSVGSDYDRDASFAGYHTFSVMQRAHQDVHNPLVVTRADDAIRAELIRKGYQQATDASTADFSVDFTIGSKERTDVNAYPDPYFGTGWGWGRRGWWGGQYWGNNLDVRQYREGTLSIDIFDAKTHRPVWHGWAKKELNRSDIQNSEEPIRTAVAAVLARFPPGGG
ncbi:MAG: DUF4136 domain-containing protein [Proteobacteria bacterium]|nr:DUF4136 domain-containing protein [Pseudomonadota bacterium]